jgi:hypothetical protein
MMKLIAILLTALISALIGDAIGGGGPGEAAPLPQRKTERSCPSGYFTSGRYCVPMAGTKRDAIPKIGQCPANWVQSGNYCLSPERRSQ